MQPLLLTEAELKALDLPGEQASRIRELAQGRSGEVPGDGEQADQAQRQGDVDSPGDGGAACASRRKAQHGRAEVIKHARGTLLYDNGGGSDWIQTGEMYQVGSAWRLVSASDRPARPLPKRQWQGRLRSAIWTTIPSCRS